MEMNIEKEISEMVFIPFLFRMQLLQNYILEHIIRNVSANLKELKLSKRI